jgi:hypothetical protein
MLKDPTGYYTKARQEVHERVQRELEEERDAER